MKASQIRELTLDEIEEKLLDTRKELFNLRVQDSVGQAEQPLRIRQLRREVARILTIKTELENKQDAKS
jgi:large subunit ribosomal protein L29